MDLEHKAIERLKLASDMSLHLYKQPLVITYSGGKDSDTLLHLVEISGIPFEVLHSLTTADAPQTVYHVRNTFHRLEDKGIKCTVDKHVQPDGSHVPDTTEADAADTACSILLCRAKRERRKRSVYCDRRPVG